MTDETTLPILKEEIKYSLEKNWPVVTSDAACKIILPEIEKVNPCAHNMILHFADCTKGRLTNYLTDKGYAEDSELLRVIPEVGRLDVLTMGAFLYKALDEQGKADRLKKQFEDK